mmetsp:Transcript_51/g.124  ORF Transcript_51/g.124 Transcript_51/m.124 type:complete len:251 (-) Transcript_51:2824-3576(-)
MSGISFLMPSICSESESSTFHPLISFLSLCTRLPYCCADVSMTSIFMLLNLPNFHSSIDWFHSLSIDQMASRVSRSFSMAVVSLLEGGSMEKMASPLAISPSVLRMARHLALKSAIISNASSEFTSAVKGAVLRKLSRASLTPSLKSFSDVMRSSLKSAFAFCSRVEASIRVFLNVPHSTRNSARRVSSDSLTCTSNFSRRRYCVSRGSNLASVRSIPACSAVCRLICDASCSRLSGFVSNVAVTSAMWE